MKRTKNSKILVTGGAGFIGSHLVDRLLKESVSKIVIIDNFVRGHRKNLKNALKDKRTKLVNGDIRDLSAVKRVMRDMDFVFHLAALKHNQCTDDPRAGHEVLVDGTFNIFEQAIKNKVKKVVYASSASVYGNPKSLPMRESDPFDDKTIYGAAKIHNERLAVAFKELSGIPFIGLRNFNVYGPRMDIFGAYTDVFIKWLNKIRNNEAPVIHGDGKQSMDFIYVTDVVEANILALEKETNNLFFNVGSGEETTLNKLVTTILKLTKSHLRPQYVPEPKHLLARRRRADTRLARKELGFKTKVNLSLGLKNLLEWYDNEIRKEKRS